MKKGVLKNFAKFTGKHKRARISFLHIDKFHQASRLCKLKIKAGLTPILGELQNELISTRSFGHLNDSLLTIIEKCL